MQHSNIQKKDCFFHFLGSSKSRPAPDKNADNPYMLDTINEVHRIFSVYGGGGKYGVASFNRLNWMMKYDPGESGFSEYDAREGRGEIRMVRVSECKYWVATVYESSICVQRSTVFFEDNYYYLSKVDSEFREEVEFTLSEGKYSYLEWSPLDKNSIERPCFLTLDDKGRLRVHYVKEKTEEIIESGEELRSATFSFNGRYIYAINNKQEICKIDLQELKIVMKRKIKGLDDPEEVISSHIQQVTPWIFAIGSVIKTDPYLHLVNGDISGQQDELKIKAFEMPLFEKADLKKPVIFRTFYLKERELLLFGHTGSNEIQGLHFGSDGIETKIDGMNLKNATLRGLIFLKDKRPIELKNEYQNRVLESSRGPQFLVLDSEGFLHHFRYSETSYCAPALSFFIRVQSVRDFVESQKRVKARLNRARKNRCKSLDSKIGLSPITHNKKRSKSQVPMKDEPSKIKITPEEKQRTIRFLKENHTKVSFGLFEPTASSKMEIKSTTKSLFQAKTEDNKLTANNLFSSKPESKSTTNSLFSAKPTENSLFTFSNKPNFLLESRNEPQNSLFGPAFKKQPETNSLFSANRAFQTVSNDPLKKKAMLLLNKLESDVSFKVEDQEFPAHKYILSEKCRFFKNMFSSGMSESYAAVIEISDTKASMFKAFLTYVYLGQTMLSEELAIGLFEFSEKYMIDELKSTCENYLKGILTLNNCFKIYETADYYEADSLKKKTLLFFQKHLKEIKERKDLEDLPKSTYIFLKRMIWNEKIIFDPEFAQLINDYK